MRYEESTLRLDDEALTLKAYYFPFGSKRIPYERIRAAKRRPMGWGTGKLRIWGTGHPRLWLNRDWRRTKKDEALVLDVGAYVRPVTSPDDPERVAAILAEHGVRVR